MRDFYREPIENLWHGMSVNNFGVFSRLDEKQLKMLHDVKVCQNKVLYTHKCAQLKLMIEQKDSVWDNATLLHKIISKVCTLFYIT